MTYRVSSTSGSLCTFSQRISAFRFLFSKFAKISKNIARTEVGVHAERRGYYSVKQYRRLAILGSDFCVKKQKKEEIYEKIFIGNLLYGIDVDKLCL